MEIVKEAFLAAIGTGMLTLIVLSIKWIWKKIHNDTITIQSISHDLFFSRCRELLDKGSMTETELENINYLYKGYKAQGLNGTGDEIHKRVLALPIE